MMQDPADLHIGIIGLGTRSEIAQYVHRPGRGARVVACCDIDPALLEDGVKRFGPDVRTTTDHRALLAWPLDAVIVLTPDHTHEPITMDALQCGVPVYVEKPLAINTQACDRLLAACRRTGTPLYVGHNMRHMPLVRAMRDLVDAGAIGEVKTIWCRHFVGHGGDYYFRDWHADRRNTLSLLLQKGAHDFDIIHWLAGGQPRRVHAMGDLAVYGRIEGRRDRTGQRLRSWWDPEHNWPPTRLEDVNPVTDVEDLSLVNLLLDNGVLASYQQCHFSPDYWRNYTVIGTEGRLENFGDAEDAVVKVWTQRSGYRHDADEVITVETAPGGHGGADARVMEEFLDFVGQGGPTLTSPVDARHAVAAGVAATASLRAGGAPVDVPPLPEDLVEYFNDRRNRAGPR